MIEADSYALVLSDPLQTARQRAQREQSRHKAKLRVRLARGDELRHLVELHEVSRLAASGHRGAWQTLGLAMGPLRSPFEPPSTSLLPSGFSP